MIKLLCSALATHCSPHIHYPALLPSPTTSLLRCTALGTQPEQFSTRIRQIQLIRRRGERTKHHTMQAFSLAFHVWRDILLEVVRSPWRLALILSPLPPPHLLWRYFTNIYISIKYPPPHLHTSTSTSNPNYLYFNIFLPVNC